MEDEEQHVFAAAKHIIRALLPSKAVSDEMRKVLTELDAHLSTMTGDRDTRDRLTSEIEDRLKGANKKIVSWVSNQSMVWDLGPEELSQYLQAADEVQRLTEILGSSVVNKNVKEMELHNRAHGILQMAMARLEEELIYILAQCKRQSFDTECFSSDSYEVGVLYEESIVSTEDDPVESEDYVIDLIHLDVIYDINSIANIMFASNYDQEFCRVFTSSRKEALDEYLIERNVENIGIEGILKMDGTDLDRRIRKWCRAIKTIVQFYLPGEKRVFNQVLGEFGSVSSNCFVEASKDSMLWFLNFGEAVALGPHLPERLFSLINMYEVLAYLIHDIDALFSEESGSFIRIEFHTLSGKLGNSAKATFLEFGNQIALKTSRTPFPKGGIPQLTNYVMNYLNTLTDYGDTLNFLLETRDSEDLDPSSSVFGPMAFQLRSVTDILETNLENRSNLYRDESLKHVFMMNNLHYMVEKVKNSEMRKYFGDEWIRKHSGKYKQQAKSYERATWSPVLAFLRDDGNSGKGILRERCRKFSIAFDEIYKSQTGWFISDVKLREDMQISTAQIVILAYRTFYSRVLKSIKEKYIKYTEDDLEKCFLHFFEGLPRSLTTTRRR